MFVTSQITVTAAPTLILSANPKRQFAEMYNLGNIIQLGGPTVTYATGFQFGNGALSPTLAFYLKSQFCRSATGELYGICNTALTSTVYLLEFLSP